MKYLKIKLVSLSFLLLANAAFAASPPPQPAACPGVAAIKAGGFDVAAKGSFFSWSAYSFNKKYDTSDAWEFFLTGFGTANNESDALIKATLALNFLYFKSGPVFNDTTNNWWCSYGAQIQDRSIIAVAVTPSMSS